MSPVEKVSRVLVGVDETDLIVVSLPVDTVERSTS
jgi:hypothetical protein